MKGTQTSLLSHVDLVWGHITDQMMFSCKWLSVCCTGLCCCSVTEKETGTFRNWSGVQSGNISYFTYASCCKTVKRGCMISCRQEETAGNQIFLWVLKATRGLYLRVLLSQTTWKHKRPRLVKLYNMYTCIMSLHEMIVLQWLHIFEPCLNQMTGNECGFETQSIQMKKLAYIIIVMSTLSTWRWLYSDISGSEFH